MNRNASAIWRGNLHNGAGTLTTESSVLSQTDFSCRGSLVDGAGTNPDELIAAALAGCFAMALARELALAGLQAESIESKAIATVEEFFTGWMISHIQLNIMARVPNSSQEQFIVAALAAKNGCSIARVLNTTISMTASLQMD